MVVVVVVCGAVEVAVVAVVPEDACAWLLVTQA